MGALSVALLADSYIIAEHHQIVGRGHADTLMPAVAAVMDGQAPPAAIVVDIGPGSFTGLRIGIAAARALGLAWDVPVTGCTSTALIAAAAFEHDVTATQLMVVLDAGRGQLYTQRIAVDLQPLGEIVAATPAEVLAALAPASVLAGPGARLLPVEHGHRVVDGSEPRAASARLLVPARRALAPAPIYLRAPDAKVAA